MEQFISLGPRVAKPYQAMGVIFSLFFIIVSTLIDPSITWFLWAVGASGLINLYYYIPSDVKYNSKEFVAEKFLFKRRIPSQDFVYAKKLLLNYYLLKFKDQKVYFHSDVKSLFKDGDDMTNEILSNINQVVP